MKTKTNTIYRPLTAHPFKCCATYKEIEPCLLLRPYIRCFWIEEHHAHNAEPDKASEIVIPDTCVDIIYRIDYTDNTVSARFNGINDRSFHIYNDNKVRHEISVIAIRFYAWSAYVFSEDSFNGTLNGVYDVRERFGWLDKELCNRLSEPGNLADKIWFIERLLVKKLGTPRSNKVVDGAIHTMLSHRGTLEAGQLSKESFISSRQMERLFHEYIGMTPKKLSNLVRYQFLWQDMVGRSDFDIQNAVYQYGYTDLAHLMREFKRYHLVNPRTARNIAFQYEISDEGSR